jgi:group I intron endonuclease
MASVYKVTNVNDGKVYVGFTTRTLEKRKREHFRQCQEPGRRSVFHNALKAHGKASFAWELVQDGLTDAEALSLEVHTIALLGCKRPAGYNILSGGQRSNMTEAGRLTLRNLRTGSKWSSESRAKLARSRTGTKRSIETKQKMSRSLKGRTRSTEQRARIGRAKRSFTPAQTAAAVLLVRLGAKRVDVAQWFCVSRATIDNLVKRRYY